MPENEPPQEDEKPKDEKKQYAEAKKLLDALTRTQATLKRLIDENGTFVFADAAGAKKARQSMIEQAEKLDALAQKDYDPIFGESYEPFVTAICAGDGGNHQTGSAEGEGCVRLRKGMGGKTRLYARSGVSEPERHDGRLAGDGRGMHRI